MIEWPATPSLVVSVMANRLPTPDQVHEITALTIRSWDVFKFVRDTESGGRNTADKCDWFADTLGDYVTSEYSKGRLDVYDLEYVILDILAAEFNVDIDGGGALVVARDIIGFTQGRGNFDQLQGVLRNKCRIRASYEIDEHGREAEDSDELGDKKDGPGSQAQDKEAQGESEQDSSREGAGEGPKVIDGHDNSLETMDVDEPRRQDDNDGWTVVKSGYRRR